MTVETATATDLDRLAVDTVRVLAMDTIQKAGSGHPGTAMSLAPAAYVLWTRFLKFDPADPEWFDRDRFVLSNGHASVLQYAVLHLTGYPLGIRDLKQQRQWGSLTPGHPEYGTPREWRSPPAHSARGWATGLGSPSPSGSWPTATTGPDRSWSTTAPGCSAGTAT